MPITIETVNDKQAVLGEGPFWDETTQSLYFVDVIQSKICRYDRLTKETFTASVGDKSVSFILPIEGQKNNFLISHGTDILKITWDGVSDKIENREVVAELKDNEEKKHQWNDAKADPFGRLWAGFLTSDKITGDFIKFGGLCALQSDKTLKRLTSNITLSNGLAWNQKINKFYYIDTLDDVFQFDYDENSTEISNRKVIFKFGETAIPGLPDGMTMDTDGNLWIASFNGGKVVKIDPRKPNTVLQIIDMPVQQITSVVFGGPNYDELYVTTASFAWKVKEVPEGGWTYKITGLGVIGVPSQKVKI